MPNMHEIIAQIQRDLYCPVCGRSFEIGEIRLKGLLDHTLIVQTICAQGHMTLFMTTIKNDSVKKKTFNTDDILDLHKALDKFDGDFQTIWKNN